MKLWILIHILKKKRKERKRSHFWELIPPWLTLTQFSVHSLLSALGWTTNAQAAKNQQKVFLKAKKTQMLGHGENHSIYLRKKGLCDPKVYLRICFKSLATCSAWFNSNGSSVLLHTLLHLPKVTLTLLIYFSDHIFCRVLPLLTTSELQAVALTPGSPPTAVTRSSHLPCDAFCVCDWNKWVAGGALG